MGEWPRGPDGVVENGVVLLPELHMWNFHIRQACVDLPFFFFDKFGENDEVNRHSGSRRISEAEAASSLLKKILG